MENQMEKNVEDGTETTLLVGFGYRGVLKLSPLGFCRYYAPRFRVQAGFRVRQLDLEMRLIKIKAPTLGCRDPRTAP